MPRSPRPTQPYLNPPSWSPRRSRRRLLARRSAAAVLAASALAGVTAVSLGPDPLVGLAAAQCDQPKAMRQLAAARQTRTDARALLAGLRLQGGDDPRAQGLSRQISALGLTPAQYTGWRQKAVDVSDRLGGTTDPKLRAVALTLARHGYGPTPADLLQDPPPPPGPVGEALGQGDGSALGGAIDSAAQAADEVSRIPDISASPPRRSRVAEPPLPETCLTADGDSQQPEPDADQTPAPDPGPSSTAAPDQTTPPPTASPTASRTASPSSEVSDLPSGAGPSTATGDATPAPLPQVTADPLEPLPGSSTPSASAAVPEPDDPGEPGDPDGGGQQLDIDQARAAIQLLGELMQALGAAGGEGSGGGDTESQQLQDLLQEALDSGQPQLQPNADDDRPDRSPGQDTSSAPETAEQTPAPDITDDTPTTSDTTDDQGSRPETSETSEASETSQTPDPSAGDEVDNEDRDGGEDPGTAWEPAADKLAEQVSQSAGDDPLAKELADKLSEAGIDVPEDTAGGSEPDSEQDATPQRTGDPDTDPDQGETDSGTDQDETDSGTGDQAGESNPQTTGEGDTGQDGTGDQQDRSAQPQEQQDGGQDTPPTSGAAPESPTEPSTEPSTDPSTAPGGESAGPGETDDAGSATPQPSPESGTEPDGETPAPEEDASGDDPAGAQPQDPQGGGPPDEGAGGADPSTWDKLADCESSGDWAADTGNGYSGGLQFAPETWAAFGGQGDPAAASREQQIAVAEKVQAEQGWNAWPACSRKLGLQ